jgi:hypothetical protein
MTALDALSIVDRPMDESDSSMSAWFSSGGRQTHAASIYAGVCRPANRVAPGETEAVQDVPDKW